MKSLFVTLVALLSAGFYIAMHVQEDRDRRQSLLVCGEMLSFYQNMTCPDFDITYRVVNHPVDTVGRASTFFFVTETSIQKTGDGLIDMPSKMRYIEVPAEYGIYPDIEKEPGRPISDVGTPAYLMVIPGIFGGGSTIFFQNEKDVLEFEAKRRH